MEFLVYTLNNEKVVEIISDAIVITELQDAIDLIGDCYYHETNKIIIHRENITPRFFDLSTKLAGDILQKISNYNFKLAIIGDFTGVKSKSLHDFILESNKGNRVFFLNDLAIALDKLTGK
jgi:Domain of unknown function (DUF4180)